ncbi:hypothetical protein SAMN05421740_102571 [Parapedobacter koreensis]|uniref:Uncharacterized protein n=1 Tax=Parapedobacter koreensis TaxID=332977 RepID=A0A1H7JIT3_9SPHI|nr:hypothetical protein SAMN05421740_102571 [Parapedobacter koreensis]
MRGLSPVAAPKINKTNVWIFGSYAYISSEQPLHKSFLPTRFTLKQAQLAPHVINTLCLKNVRNLKNLLIYKTLQAC